MKILKLFFLACFFCLASCSKSGLSDSSGETEAVSDTGNTKPVVLDESGSDDTTEIPGDSPAPPAEGQSVLLPLDLSKITASSMYYSNDCPDGVQESGFNYFFTNTIVSRTGSNSWGNTCIAAADYTEEFVVASLAEDEDFPFNCVNHPTCSSNDFNKTLVFSDGSQLTLAYDSSSNTLSAIKLNLLAGSVTTETIILNYL